MNRILAKIKAAIAPIAPLLNLIATPAVRALKGKEPMLVAFVVDAAANLVAKLGLHLSASQLVGLNLFVIAATNWAARQMVRPLADAGVHLGDITVTGRVVTEPETDVI